MTLHEQYKEDTKPHPFLKNKGHVKILMKKAYLNSIDCMISENKSELILEPSSSRGQGHNDALKIMIKYYFEQRELIANEK
jgi:hypothetical protein